MLQVPNASPDTLRFTSLIFVNSYQPPEVCRDQKDASCTIDFLKCDLWAFGILCWEVMACGTRYYDNHEILELLKNKRTPGAEFDTKQSIASVVADNLPLV